MINTLTAFKASSSVFARHLFKPDTESFCLSVAPDYIDGKVYMAAGFTDGTHKLWDINSIAGVSSLDEPSLVIKKSVEIAPIDCAFFAPGNVSMWMVTTSLDGLKAYSIQDKNATLLVDSNELVSIMQVDQGP